MENKASVDIKRQYFFTEFFLILAMILLIFYSEISVYNSMSASLMSVGENALARQNEQVDSCLEKSKNVLSVSAITIDNMLEFGAGTADIEKFMKLESERFATDFDSDYSGIYGYIGGVYLDGAGWIPEEDYVPTERAWYISAKEAGNVTVITPPYLDARTGEVLISISRLLNDGESVVAMDVVLNEIQKITESINLNGEGYALIFDRSGMVISSSFQSKSQNVYVGNEQVQSVFREIAEKRQGHLKTELYGSKMVAFFDEVTPGWISTMFVEQKNLYKELLTIMLMIFIVCALVFAVVMLFVARAFHKIMVSSQSAEESSRKADNMYLTIVKTLAQAIDAKDEYTNGHSQRVGEYAKELAIRMGKSEDEVNSIYYAALLHDVGKIRVPDGIINKPGGLTDDEFRVMKLHPISGYHILRYVNENPLICIGAREHHERYDGRGYPNGLKGEEISEVGRIIAVADAYDAMTSNRSYRSTMTQERVREQIEKGKGCQFDPDIADIMLGMIDEDKDYNMRQHSKSKKTIMMVDDDEIQLELLENVIQTEPEYGIIKAQSGAEALELIKREEVDIILLDLNLPGMSGFEVYEMLKPYTNANPDCPVQVVFLTGDTSRESIDKAFEIGAADYLVKPFNSAAVLEVLHSLFQERKN